MFSPSLVTRPEGTLLATEEIEPGVFLVKNAYDGVLEYFPGQPLGRVENGVFYPDPTNETP